MRVEIQMEGGLAHFPGLARPVAIEVERWSADDRAEIQRLLEATRFFTLPPEVPPATRSAADTRSYIVTVEDGGRRHTVRFNEPLADAQHSRLIGFLRTKAREARRSGA